MIKQDIEDVLVELGYVIDKNSAQYAKSGKYIDFIKDAELNIDMLTYTDTNNQFIIFVGLDFIEVSESGKLYAYLGDTTFIIE